MHALDALQKRVSSPKLSDPAPTLEQREHIYKAALRAADHANLRPWRFLVLEGEDRNKLGELFLSATLAQNPDIEEAQRVKLLKMPLRAPLVLVAIAPCVEHAKVPELEQHLSCGAAVQNILTAAYAQGVGAYWRTGALAYNPEVKQGLKLNDKDLIVGFIYMGTHEGRAKPVPALSADDYFQAPDW